MTKQLQQHYGWGVADVATVVVAVVADVNCYLYAQTAVAAASSTCSVYLYARSVSDMLAESC